MSSVALADSHAHLVDHRPDATLVKVDTDVCLRHGAVEDRVGNALGRASVGVPREAPVHLLAIDGTARRPCVEGVRIHDRYCDDGAPPVVRGDIVEKRRLEARR